ncbi:MAG: 50S ribosomal protein L24 [Cyclobacteriaceae bacterium]|jgi:large subunit ribosomal protein L24|nr:50S ribosomal protein L24 [Cyclobacteriaceae bacterium]MDH4297726.1 50S ribosomal protein L24 [Cyclobacteriaceae bacterium]MDH5248421.1 50S ribosomal protein L24 [Cyclobacteriaceae bacterium]
MEKRKNSKPKLHIRKGDTVKVLAGDDKGKTGAVLEIVLEKNRAIVEGINIVTKHTKPSAGKPEGGIKKTEAALHISNLMLIDPASGKATRTGRKLNDKNKLQRYSKKTGEFIK